MRKKTYHFELALVLGLVFIFLIQSLAVAQWALPVWQDEAMYTDPAANLYMGHGFTSRGWHFQLGDEFWAGNVPLHEILSKGPKRLENSPTARGRNAIQL